MTADDFGLCPEVDAGVLDLLEAGVVTAVAVLVNPPFGGVSGPTAGWGSLTERFDGWGLHVNLSLGRPAAPVAQVPALVDEAGQLHGQVDRLVRPEVIDQVRVELAAQVDAFRALTGRLPAHLTSHKHLGEGHPALFEAFLDLAGRLGCPVRTRSDLARQRCRERRLPTPDHFRGDVCPGGYWTEARLADLVEGLAPGVTEVMCHPGRPMAARAGVWYAAEREIERRAWLAWAAGPGRALVERWRGRATPATGREGSTLVGFSVLQGA
ncbi:MAG: Cellobiose phosphotransferase system YdjC-like protein [Candidatus Ozemobacter sibiricus]|uniref:Cellobiose phosphotransferase system YdjC-like protein n=1 Tax=Candidatus Ozemobacter sibiricus TaxID=2268124 RepID=A0A367ZLH6_9BACT|nr:MAG: Cellobiose phosphotransferase system YdjC-like protein [Candidatus Ozemobacter sibiricus]